MTLSEDLISSIKKVLCIHTMEWFYIRIDIHIFQATKNHYYLDMGGAIPITDLKMAVCV
jgi:hypothetical protein